MVGHLIISLISRDFLLLRNSMTNSRLSLPFGSVHVAFLFGATSIIRDVALRDGNGMVTRYSLDAVQRKLGLGRQKLICLAVMVGSDYAVSSVYANCVIISCIECIYQ